MFHFLFLSEGAWEASRNFLSFGYCALKLFLNFASALTIIAIFPIVWILDFMYPPSQGGDPVFVLLIFAVLYLMVLICVGWFQLKRYLCWKYMIIGVTIELVLLYCRCIFTFFTFSIPCCKNCSPLFCFLLSPVELLRWNHGLLLQRTKYCGVAPFRPGDRSMSFLEEHQRTNKSFFFIFPGISSSRKSHTLYEITKFFPSNFFFYLYLIYWLL